jgi:hypothetical protein
MYVTEGGAEEFVFVNFTDEVALSSHAANSVPAAANAEVTHKRRLVTAIRSANLAIELLPYAKLRI